MMTEGQEVGVTDWNEEKKINNKKTDMNRNEWKKEKKWWFSKR